MTIPNLFSASRIALAPVLMFLILANQAGGLFIAALLVVFAGASDSIDGYLARRFKQVSAFGVFLDLTADKVMVAAIIVSLVQIQLLPAWVAAIILGREFIITGLRLSAASNGLIIPAQGWGKSKTVVTLVAITFIILRQDFLAGGPMALLNPLGVAGILLDRLTWPLVLLATALTIVSGLTYIVGTLSALSEKSQREAVGVESFALSRKPQSGNQFKRMTSQGASSVFRLVRKMREVW